MIAADKHLGRDVMLLSMAAFASAAALRMCDPMLPALADTFHITVARAAIVITATSVAYGICQFFFGPLGDRFGKFRVIALACLACTVGALGSALSPTLEWLSIARALTGATTAALIPLSMAWIGDVVAFEQRQPTLAKFMSGQIVGLVSGQALGGLFADTVGWRWGFVFLAVIYLAVGLLLLREMRQLPKPVSTPSYSNVRSQRGSMIEILTSPNAHRILTTVFMEAMATFGVIAFIPAYCAQNEAMFLKNQSILKQAEAIASLARGPHKRRIPCRAAS